MAIATTNLPTDAPTDNLPENLPEIPDGWTETDRDELPFEPHAGWQHDQTGQQVTVEHNRRPTQMHTPETSEDDTGFNANVYREDGTGCRYLSNYLGEKVKAYEAAVRFMATYPEGDFEIPEPGVWGYDKPCDWEADDE